ncbi:MAG: hypothetical protein HOF43_05320 [Chloroflexi bacterium]|nr:hypothetical protein [Chloroflexota bacterium]
MNDASTSPASVSLSAMQDLTGVAAEATGRAWPTRVLLIVVASGVLLVAPIALHEAIHVFVAFTTGVSPSAMDIGFVGVYPGVEINDPLDGWRLSLFHYSGGLVAGGAMLYLYIRWYWKWSGNKTTFEEWWLGALILITAGNEIGNGIAEGAFNAEYIANQEPASLISLVATVGGFLVHRIMLGSRGARLAVMRGEVGDRNQIEERLGRRGRREPRWPREGA